MSALKPKRRRRKRLGGWRRLSRGSWQFRVRGTRPNGEPFLISRACTEQQKELVEVECKRLAEEYRAGLSSPARSYTLSQWQKDCIKAGFAWTPQNESTWKLLRSMYGYSLESLDALAIQKWVIATLYQGDGRPPIGMASPGYLRHAFELLRRLIKRAVSMRVLTAIPWGSDTPACIPRYSVAHKKRDPIPDSHLLKILDAARAYDRSVYIRVLLSAETGARPFELARAKRSWLVPIEEIVGAPRIAGAAVLLLPSAKGGNPHDVPISATCYREYRQWFDSLPNEARDTGSLVPIERNSHWFDPSAVGVWISRYQWQAILRNSGLLEGYVLYQLRHTRLAKLANDCGPRIAQAIGGHTSVITTERYIGRARGLVPSAFSSVYRSNPEPEPEPIDIGRARKNRLGTEQGSVVADSETDVSTKAIIDTLHSVIGALGYSQNPLKSLSFPRKTQPLGISLNAYNHFKKRCIF